MVAPFGTASGAANGGPERWKPPLVAALRRMAVGDLNGALPLLEEAFRAGPDVPEVCLAYGRELARRGDERGLELLERAHSRDPGLLSAGAELARRLADAGRLRRAVEVVHTLTNTHPGDPLAWICRGEVALQCGRTADAETCGDRARALAVDSDTAARAADALLARTHNQRGLERSSAADFESALFAFRRAADLDPRWSAPLTNMGSAFSRLGKHQRAIDLYSRASGVDPDDPLPRLELGRELAEIGEWTAARAQLEGAVRMLLASEERQTGLLAQAHCALASVYRQLGADARAVRALEYASHLAGAGAGIWAELARAHVRCGELSKARRAARIALAIEPDSTQVRQAWTELAGLRARRRAHRREAR